MTGPRLPVASLGKDGPQLFKIPLVINVEPALDCAIDVDDGDNLSHCHQYCRTQEASPCTGSGHTHLLILEDRHHDLTLRVPVTSNMPRKFLYIWHQLRLLALGRGTTDTPAKGNRLACDFALEGPQDQLVRLRCIEDIEPGPIHLIARRWQGVEGVPDEGSSVGGIAFTVRNGR